MKANSKRKVFGDAVDLLMGDMEEVTMPMTGWGSFWRNAVRLLHLIRKNRVNCIRLTERIACRTANISVVPRISILRWTRLAITVFARIPECRSWD